MDDVVQNQWTTCLELVNDLAGVRIQGISGIEPHDFPWLGSEN